MRLSPLTGSLTIRIRAPWTATLVTALLVCFHLVCGPAGKAYGGPLFQAAALFDVGENPASVAVGDLNGDGRPDLVTANESSFTVSVLLGYGDGTFQTKADY